MKGLPAVRWRGGFFYARHGGKLVPLCRVFVCRSGLSRQAQHPGCAGEVEVRRTFRRAGGTARGFGRLDTEAAKKFFHFWMSNAYFLHKMYCHLAGRADTRTPSVLPLPCRWNELRVDGPVYSRHKRFRRFCH